MPAASRPRLRACSLAVVVVVATSLVAVSLAGCGEEPPTMVAAHAAGPVGRGSLAPPRGAVDQPGPAASTVDSPNSVRSA